MDRPCLASFFCSFLVDCGFGADFFSTDGLATDFDRVALLPLVFISGLADFFGEDLAGDGFLTEDLAGEGFLEEDLSGEGYLKDLTVEGFLTEGSFTSVLVDFFETMEAGFFAVDAATLAFFSGELFLDGDVYLTTDFVTDFFTVDGLTGEAFDLVADF